jgi:hypothetical protein
MLLLLSTADDGYLLQDLVSLSPHYDSMSKGAVSIYMRGPAQGGPEHVGRTCRVRARSVLLPQAGRQYAGHGVGPRGRQVHAGQIQPAGSIRRWVGLLRRITPLTSTKCVTATLFLLRSIWVLIAQVTTCMLYAVIAHEN